MPDYKTFAASATLLLVLCAPHLAAQQAQAQAINAQSTATNSNGIVLGDPQNAVDDLRRIYQILQQYKARHQGQMPADLQALLQTLATDAKAYGFESYDAVRECLSNPDYRLQDASISPSEARITINYTINFRANLSADDVLAYTDVYVYNNIHSNNKGDGKLNRVGFYVVLRADGSTEKVPYDEVLSFAEVISPNQQTTRINFFRTSADELLFSTTYGEQWGGSNPLGKPTPGAMLPPIADNGGPEALVQLSRRQMFPDSYGIDREKLWATFSPTEPEFSLWDIEAGAKKLGLNLEVATRSLAQLQETGAPALLFLQDSGHIVALTALDDDRAVIVDKGVTENLARTDLEKRYFGDALVPTQTLTSGAVASDNVRLIELTSRDTEVAQQVEIRNRGTREISLQLEPLAPGVTSAQLSASTLAPGEVATLDVKLKWRSVVWAREQNVLFSVRTNDPVTPRLQTAFLLVAPR